MKLLLDEMYPGILAVGLRAVGIDATTVAALKLTGASDTELFAAALAGSYVVLTENVGDFAQIVAEHSAGGSHHPGVLIALSSRFSRRPTGAKPLIAAIKAIAEQDLQDRAVYLERPREA